jgi:LacI family transcriptional regulator
MTPRPIAVIADVSARYGRDLVRGIAAWARPREAWELRLVDHAWCQHPDRQVAGVIGYVRDPRTLLRRGVPMVDLTVRPRPASWLPAIDEGAVGAAAAAHLREAGHQRFATVTIPEQGVVGEQRQAGFLAAVTAAEVADPAEVATAEGLEHWLKALPTPIGVFAANDTLAARCAAACRRLGRAIPDEIALIGADDDDVLCELGTPALSSVAMPHTALGLAAATVLAQLLAGQDPGPGLRIPPRGVVTRASTAATAVPDALCARALGLIRARAIDPTLDVEVLAAACGVPRRLLERRFRAVLGRSPWEEVRRARIARARNLLRETDQLLPDIAAAVGWSLTSFSDAFRAEMGQSPGDWRRSVEGLAASGSVSPRQ